MGGAFQELGVIQNAEAQCAGGVDRGWLRGEAGDKYPIMESLIGQGKD